MAAITLRLLFAEDNPDDAELQLREIRRAGLRVTHKVVDTAEAFSGALRSFVPDIILSDFSMPQFDGMEALRLAREIAPHTPFIFVSGTLGEEYAIRALKNGATDYVVKTNLARLPAAVERAMAEAEVLRERRRTATELEIARERLQEREAGLRRAQAVAKLAHVITGEAGQFESWSETLPQLLGLEPSGMPRSTREWLEMLHPDDREPFRAKSIEASNTGARTDIEYRLRRADGQWIDLRQVVEPLASEGQASARSSSRWFSTLQDITEQKRAAARISRLNRVYAVLSGINGLIVRVRDREELYREACAIAVQAGRFKLAWIGIVDRKAGALKPVAVAGDAQGYVGLMPLKLEDDPPKGLAGHAVKDRAPMIANDVENDARLLLRAEAVKRGFRSLVILPLIASDEPMGVLALYADSVGFFDEAEMKLLMELAGDISFALNHIEKSEKLDYLAYYDDLTGLANRSLLRERLSQYLHASAEGKQKLAFVIADLERFRAVNDSLGRQSGDLLLAEVAERLRKSVGDANQLARLGTDHFAVVFPAVKSELDAGRMLLDLSRACLREPFQIAGKELLMSSRAGIALYPDHGADADTLLRNAEAALQRAKDAGEPYLFFEERMTQRVADNLSLETALRHALERNEFVLHYQPRIDLRTRRIEGVEALIRWQSPQGLVPPAKFIGLMEETGLIGPVGAWALQQAVEQHQSWLREGLRAPRIAVNVSVVQLRQKDFVAAVQRVIGLGAKPPGIDLEITESMIMGDVEENIAKLQAVRDLGLSVAIDDFGTGYSSLAYLARLPVAALKIDRSFIITMLKDARTMTLVSTMISLAHSLGLKVVAEGVDAEEQAAALLRMGCDEMQGYLYSKPLPAGELEALLGKGSEPD
jgi:diguanylate cyclase (GGDEF)-like protein/PAS domain S-box-containing protein